MDGHRVGNDMQVVRNRSNQVSGWLIWVMMTVVWGLNDSMGLIQSGPVWATRLDGLVTTLGFAAVSLLGVLVFAVPFVGLSPQAVVVQNFLTRRVIPRASIIEVREGAMWPALWLVDGRRVRLFGAERSTWMHLRGVSVLDAQRLGQSEEVGSAEGSSGVKLLWQVPTPVKVVIAFWGLVIVVGLIFGRFV